MIAMPTEEQLQNEKAELMITRNESDDDLDPSLQDEKSNVQITINETNENLDSVTSEPQEEEEELDVLTLTLPQRPPQLRSLQLL
jgi:hypothetical protein